MSAVWGLTRVHCCSGCLSCRSGVWLLRCSAGNPDHMSALVLAVMGIIGVGFLAFMLLRVIRSSHPAVRAIKRCGPEPLLQDPGLIFHPPMLYMGYVGLSVAFAFAMASLSRANLIPCGPVVATMDNGCMGISHPWHRTGKLVGILRAGWGGWWFWDPVENASLIPWLVATALMHSLAVTEKRGLFRVGLYYLRCCLFAVATWEPFSCVLAS